MNGGAKFFATAAVLVATGCGGERPEFQIRPTKAPLSATARPVPYRIAEAHGQLALGNVALAIESFRKAHREQPDSIDAMVGLALSYDRMNRFDVSRRYYESALAVAPADTGVLNAFARSLDAQGLREEAAAVRSEIRTRMAAASPPLAPAVAAPAQQQAIAQVQTPAIGRSVTIALPPARPVAPVVAKRPAPQPVPASKPAPKVAAAAPVVAAPKLPKPTAAPLPAPAVPVPAAVEIAAAPAPAKVAPVAVTPKPAPLPPVPEPVVSRPVETKAAEAPAPAVPPVVVSKPVVRADEPPAPTAPVTVAMKVIEPIAPAPAAPVAIVPKPVEVAAAPPTPKPVVVAQKPVETVAIPVPSPAPVLVERELAMKPAATSLTAPRLERLSPGEVALVTTGRPQWRPTVVSRTAQSTTVRFVPLRTAEARRVKIKLLNAARYQGLAARTRRMFAQRGWRQLAIGNARRARQTSLILYPANRRDLAKRLGAQFGIAIARNATGTEVVVLLGRDAARRGLVQG